MIELPWQIVAASIGSFTVICIALIIQNRDRADRDTVRRNETDRQTRQAIYEGIKKGFEISQQLHQQAHEESICHYRRHFAAGSNHDKPSEGSVP